MTSVPGVVYLVGAGPGDPGLLTCRGLQCLERAEVLVYDGLVSLEVLALVPEGCERVYAGKKSAPEGRPLAQEEINALLVRHGRAGKTVVRLKGGDPFVFGRGTEECLDLAAAGVRFEVVPGVSAAMAATSYAGIPLTARGVSTSAVLVTGHEAAGKAGTDVDWQAIAGSQTIVLFMAWKKIATCVNGLLAAGLEPATPAAAIRWGTTAKQKTLVTTLSQLPEKISQESMRPPVLIVIGGVVQYRESLAWFESRPLFGKRILITRSRQRSTGLTTALRDLGAHVMSVPTTTIRWVEGAAKSELSDSLQMASSYHWIVFTSANAVAACFAILEELGLDARSIAPAKVAAVGRATKEALRIRGVLADLVSNGKSGVQLCRDLLEQLDSEGTAPSATRILFPQAAKGRKEPVTLLRKAGCTLDLRIAYYTEQIVDKDVFWLHALTDLRAGRVHAMVFFSPSQVRAWIGLEPDAISLLKEVSVIAAIGETTAAELKASGIVAQVVPEEPTSPRMVEALLQALSPSIQVS